MATTSTSLPATMRAWQYTTTKGGLVPNLKLVEKASMVKQKDPATQHIVKTQHVCLNPVDYKPAEGLPDFVIPKPATPGIDFVGTIVTPATNSPLKPGQIVYGFSALSPFAGGALAEYAAVPTQGAVPIPKGVDPVDAATLGVCGLTAYQSIVPHVKKGDKVFINGGSGGTGVMGIQIAKLKGCRVTTSCSTPNVAFCKDLGADEVIDYKTTNVVDALAKMAKFNHVVDNVGSDQSIYWRSNEYTAKGARFINVAAEPSFAYFSFSTKAKILPRGGRPKFEGILAQPDAEQLMELGKWLADGKLRAVVDSRFAFEQVTDAFKRLKTQRARGKVVVDVDGA